jgi:hypothetical protein
LSFVLSQYARQLIATAVSTGGSVAFPATLYLHLYTTNPTPADSGSEVTGGGYSAQSVAFGSPTNGVCASTGDVTISTPSGSIGYGGLRDSATSGGGHLWFFGPLGTTLTGGGSVLFPAGQITAGFN